MMPVLTLVAGSVAPNYTSATMDSGGGLVMVPSMMPLMLMA